MKWMGVATFLLLLSPALAAGETMAEAARKAKEAREKNAKAGVKAKSYTQEDVKDAPPLANDPGKPPAKTGSTSRYTPPSPASGGSTVTASELAAAARAGSSSPGSASPGSASTGGQSESAWRARVAQAQRRVEDARKVHEYWNRHTLVRGEVLVDETGRTVVGSIEELQGKTAAARRALEGAERALANLEEEARRAGVPPGWLR